MEESMFQRLKVASKRLEEIDQELLDENTTRDIKHFREISKERANLEPQVESFNRYLKMQSDYNDALEMSNDSDPEIAEMGKEEAKNLSKEMETLEEELRLLLLPKDPNDDKNIIVEIRGAAGGDEANIFAGDLFRIYLAQEYPEGGMMFGYAECGYGCGRRSKLRF